MKKNILWVLVLLCCFCACNDEEKEETNYSKHLIGEWKCRVANMDGFDLEKPPTLYWKGADGIYHKYANLRFQFRANGTYAMVLDSVCQEPGFTWDTVTCIHPYSVSKDNITGLFSDYLFGAISKKGLKNTQGVIVRDSVSKTGSIPKDSIAYSKFAQLKGKIYHHTEVYQHRDYSILTDRFNRDDTTSVRPWIYIRINRVN